MAAPSLQPLEINQPLGTPAAEWAQQTVEAIDPNASTGVVTDVSGNPTTDHTKSALEGEPGPGMNAGKTGAVLEAQKIRPESPAKESVPVASQNTTRHDEQPQTESAPTLYTDAQGNPTTNPDASALPSATGGAEPYIEPQARPTPKLYTDIQGNHAADSSSSALTATPGVPGHQQSVSVASTPGVQLPGGWIRGPESRQHSIIIPETSLYEDVSAALGTVGQAAFSVLPASVVGSISNNPEQGGAKPSAAQDEPTTPTKSSPAPPRSGSPGLLSRAQGMLTGLLARPASPPAKLPVPDAPTTTGEAALVGGGSVAETANKHGDNIAAGQDLGGHNPKGVLEDDEQTRLEKEASARAISPESANTAANFLNADLPTPDPTKPPQDSGLSGSLLPALPDDGKKSKNKGHNLGSLISPDRDVQEAASKSNRDFSAPIPGAGSEESKSPALSPAANTQSPLNEGAQPIVTKASDSGVKEKLLDIKDVVVAPFAGSRAPKESEELARVASDPPKKDKTAPAPIDQATKSSANPEGIRTAANPHTAHTGLPLPRDEAGKEHVGGTAVLSTASPTGKQDSRGASEDKEGRRVTENKERRRASESNKDTGEGTHIPGISSHGEGQGKILADGEGGVSTAAAANGAPATSEKATGNGTAPGSPNKGVSRLWSRSRRSVDEGTIGSKTTRSRFSEHEPSTGSDSPSNPASPSGSKFKVPLKDKIKGELKIISGKVSRNEAKVEQGIALKTGHAHADESSSPTTGKH